MINREKDRKRREEIKQKLRDYKQRIKEKRQQEKEERRERRHKLIRSFTTNLLENKKYLLSFLITFVFLGIVLFNQLSQEVDKVRIANDIEEEVVETINKGEKLEEKVDVTNYVGIYSRTINLQEEININTCTMSSYKIIYQIESNRKITKYLISDCLGTIKLYESTLSYYDNGGARYIGTELNNFIFGTNSMKEVDGETYKIDQDITRLQERTIDKNIDIDYPDNNIIIATNDNLYLIKESVIIFKITEDYQNKGGNLTKRVYKTDNYSYKFIVFSNEEQISCYDNEDSDELLYTIYKVSYNKDSKEFSKINSIITRNKNAGCNTYKEDLEVLKG